MPTLPSEGIHDISNNIMCGLSIDFQTDNQLNACQMCPTHVQPMSTFTGEKTKCRGLNQIETKMQHRGENRMCDAK
jgi:hypothetical protein